MNSRRCIRCHRPRSFILENVTVRSADNRSTFRQDYCGTITPHATMSKLIFWDERITIDYNYKCSKKYRHLWLKQVFIHGDDILEEITTRLPPAEANSQNRHSMELAPPLDSPAFAAPWGEYVIMVTEIYNGNTPLDDFTLLFDD
ncbi:hypothetical protein Zmor_016058 [Zophobas morio]|uniref:Uncharacterized protein n=1 Tax=Zophobas morio TaxID=2755281 RepID=A0AA38MI40_9CUCU|nr:hypothetical protein Zmor_016058 [Zophobas morio]